MEYWTYHQKRNKIMKNILSLMILMLISTLGFSQRLTKKDQLHMYKEYATYRCMCEITDDVIEKVLWKKKEISFSVHSELLGVSYDDADSVGRAFARKIKPIQVDKGHDLYGFRMLYIECLNFFNSKILADKAKKSYRQFLLAKDINYTY